VQFLTGNYNASLGTGAGRIRWEGSGGFAALSGDRRVRLNNSTASINWDAQYFVGEGNVLILGSAVASGTVLWDKGLNINVSEARIRVVDGAASNLRAEAVLQQAISGSGTLIIEGDGRIDATVNNASFTGDIIVAGAELRLNKAGKLGAVGNFQITSGGTLTLDNVGTHTAASGGQYLSGRISTTAEVELSGGTLRYIGQSNASTTESLSEIKLESGANTIDLQNPNTGAYTKVSAKLTPNFDEGMTVNFFSGSGSTYRSTAQASSVLMQLIGSVFPTFGDGSILPWATVNGNDWATVQNGHIVPFQNYNLGSYAYVSPKKYEAYFNTSSGEDIAINPAFSSGRTIDIMTPSIFNSIKIHNGSGVRFMNQTILKSGGIIVSGVGLELSAHLGASISTQGSTPLWIHNTISSPYVFSIKTPILIPGRGIIHSGQGNTWLREGFTHVINGDSFINEGFFHVLAINSLGGTVTVRTAPSSRATLSVNGGTLTSDASVILDGVQANEGNAPRLTYTGSVGSPSLPSLSFNLLQVNGRGVLRFAAQGSERKLFLNHLVVFPEDNTGLYVELWENFVSYILVKKTSPLLMASLPYINFEGYEPGAGYRDYSDASYWEIIPLSMMPEPTTYGAIFGVMGLGLWAWRRQVRKPWRRRVQKASTATSAEGSQH